MGYYINPAEKSKEQFLIEKGTRLNKPPKWNEIPKGSLPVAFVDNGMFSAAAICYSESELAEFNSENDPRSKIFYMVPIKELVSVTDPNFSRVAIELT